ncbi:ribokinase [Robinsoniella sp. KNHs210]|uniref:ribokinase n=1 Tax=Robinsoniella sp. KNHs210 TaxID=1469950 RepID=UPI000486CE78|nr:ribokinase [Robinsoniella sp. KNHs210]
MLKNNKRIVVLGDMIYDCFIWADHLPHMGETVSGFDSGFFSGGKGANQAVQAARLGAEVYLISMVGDDDRGRFLCAELVKAGVNVSHVIMSKEHSTSTCCVHVDKEGNNAIIVAPMANEHITREEILACRQLIESADVFMTQLQVNTEAVEIAVKIAYEANVPIVLNPAPAKTISEEVFHMADFLTPNETEAEFYTGVTVTDENLEEITERFRMFGARGVIITLGSRGAYYSVDGEQGIVPAFKIEPVDATAAGDSFNAVFAYAVACGKSVSEAIRLGNAGGALTTTRKGSQVSMPDGNEIEKFILAR